MTSNREAAYLIPDDWDGQTYVDVFLCWPNSRKWRAVLYGQISALCRGRTWDRDSGTITEAQNTGKEIFDTMAVNCFDEVVAALNAIASAIGTGSGSGGCNCCAGGETGVVVEQPPSDGTISVGPGEQFETLSEYELSKCAAANGIVDTLKEIVDKVELEDWETLFDISVTSVIGLVSAIIAAAAFGWSIGVVIGAVGAVVGLMGSNVGFDLADLKIFFENNRDELICALFSAGDTEQARQQFDDVIEGGGLSLFEEQFLGFLVTDNLLNQLFSPRDDVPNYQSPSPTDCAVACPCGFKMIAGSEDGNGNFTSALVSQPPTNAISFRINTRASGFECGPTMSVQIIGTSGHTNWTGSGGNSQNFRIASTQDGLGEGCAGWDIYCDDPEPGQEFNGVRSVNIRSDTPFTAQISVLPDP